MPKATRRKPAEPAKGHRSWFTGVIVLLSFCALLKAPTLVFEHTEPDELIYWQLSENLVNHGRYSLQGTEILPSLSPFMYDRELFHYPPLFALLLAPFVLFGIRPGAIVVSWAGHFLCVVAVALIGKRMLAVDGRSSPTRVALFLVPLAGMAVDPFLTFVSRKLWTDSILAGLTSLALALFYVACKEKRPPRSFVVAGLVLGLAALVKPTALIVAPVVIYLVVTSFASPRERWTNLLYGGLPAALLVLPWVMLVYSAFGVLIPHWVKPDAWLLEHYPFVRRSVERPVYYYFKKLALIQPVVVLFVLECVRRKCDVFRNRDFVFPLLWFGVVMTVVSYAGTTGYGFQTRHIEILYPSVYVMMHAFFRDVDDDRFSLFVLSAALCVLYAGITGGIYLFVPGSDEIQSMLELSGLAG